MDYKVKLQTSLLFFGMVIFPASHNRVVLDFIRDNVPNSRAVTLQLAVHLMGMRDVSTIVETGTMRGGGWQAYTYDGGFTHLFGMWSKLNNAHLYSVDNNEQAVRYARSMVKKENLADHVTIVHEDSLSFLKAFTHTIDLLYLDSFDFDQDNPLPSQQHHLHEIEAAYDKLTDRSIIVIDDCGLPHGGKGKLALEFLKEKGWQIFAEDYQVVLIKDRTQRAAQ